MQATLSVRGIAPKKLVDRLLQLKNAMPRISAELATVTMEQIDKSWSARTSPDGKAWKPTKCRNNPILEELGNLRASLSVMPSARSFTVSITDWKATIHHNGCVIKPRALQGPKARGKGGRFKRIKGYKAKYLVWFDGCGWHKAKKVRIPARPLLPRGRLPATWKAAYRTKVIAMLKASIG